MTATNLFGRNWVSKALNHVGLGPLNNELELKANSHCVKWNESIGAHVSVNETKTGKQ